MICDARRADNRARASLHVPFRTPALSLPGLHKEERDRAGRVNREPGDPGIGSRTPRVGSVGISAMGTKRPDPGNCVGQAAEYALQVWRQVRAPGRKVERIRCMAV